MRRPGRSRYTGRTRTGAGVRLRPMPELPEVETVRRMIAGVVVGARVASARAIRRAYVIGSATPRALLADGVIESVRRHGKQLAIVADDGRSLGVHLGMTGGLRVLAPGEPTPGHTHVEWDVETDSGHRRVVMADARRFGGVWTFASFEELRRRRWATLGPDALSIPDDEFADRLGRTRRAVKAALLDQRLLAGVGNIYADESLHAAGVHPGHPSARLSRARARRLGRAIRWTLDRAIAAGGSTVRDYRDPTGVEGAFAAAHAVYGRAGAPCLRCGRRLRSGVISGRTTVWCGSCQRGPDSRRA
ncbi:MAG: bifunctional DNA-formamidopyrimidine glycosylase/DNA-(apurinic or apyrimidinic site) lyase [Planctomycetota bacterium]|nr:MAG: bifunctional DNA-formamidopyrimidine glycosylase/DNA-(apurinic or apyrimidinic site) lyase [Planctomycetota bacterium]